MCSIIGDDGSDLIRHLSDHSIDTDLVKQCDRFPTANYTAVHDPSGELAFGLADMAIYDQIDAHYLGQRLPALLNWPVWFIDANLPMDGLNFLTSHKTTQLICAAPVSTRKVNRFSQCMSGVDVWIGNVMEASEMTGLPTKTLAEANRAAEALYDLGPKIVVVTMGRDGAVLKTDKGIGNWVPPETQVVNVNGAGDSFYAGFLSAYLGGERPEQAMEKGMAVSSLTAECANPVRSDLDIELVLCRRKEVSPHFLK